MKKTRNAQSQHELAHRYLLKTARKNHQQIAAVLTANGVLQPRRTDMSGNLFHFLVRTVIGQQLSTRAAATIWKRLLVLSEERKKPLQRLLTPRYRMQIASCGISQMKLKTLLLLNKGFQKGQIDDRTISICGYDEITERITAFWGLGNWSADMVAIFYAGLPDVWPKNDLALNRGVKILLPGQQPAAVAMHYAPYRTYFARHIWRWLNSRTDTT